VDDVVAFYDHLQKVALGYIIAIIPFNAIVLAHKFEGLRPPSLGLVKYAAMCKALMELLPWLIPGSLSPQVNATLTLVRYESNNGYDYLWRVLELTVPGFDPTVPIHTPIWSDVKDIFQFAQAFLLFFHLQAKVKFHYDDCTQSRMFLRAMQFSEYADTVTILQLHVNSFRQEYDNGYLPPHLRLHGLTTSIHQNAQAWLRDIIPPCVRRVLDNEFSFARRTFNRDYSLVQGFPRANPLGRDDHPRGATWMANNDGYHGRGGNDDYHGRHKRLQPPDGASAQGRGRDPRAPGRLARPDRNRCPFLPDIQCAASKQVGHLAKHCDMLATAICLERYMKHDLSPALRGSIEKEWLDRWKEQLGNPTQTPRQVLCAYVEELDITVAGLDNQMEWDYWKEDDVDSPQLD
jgi:hypothetical protein